MEIIDGIQEGSALMREMRLKEMPRQTQMVGWNKEASERLMAEFEENFKVRLKNLGAA